jgi:hypothetical protein
MRLARPIQREPIEREPARPDALGAPLNSNVQTCEACDGTGFVQAGWCQECQGLGWYAIVRPVDVAGVAMIGGAAIGLIVLALAL